MSGFEETARPVHSVAPDSWPTASMPGHPPVHRHGQAPTHLPPVAGLGRRVVARLLDQTLVVAVMCGVFIPMMRAATEADPTGDRLVFPVLAMTAFLGIGLPFLSEWLQLVMFGRTLGKMACGIRVVPVERGSGKLPPGRAAARAILFPAPAMIWIYTLVVLVLVSVDHPLRQGLHDKAAKSIVVA